MGYLNSRFPKWAAVDAALSSEGWKLVTLLRLSPVVPWNVLNYALSVTGKLAPAPCVLRRCILCSMLHCHHSARPLDMILLDTPSVT